MAERKLKRTCGAKTRKGTPCKNPPMENGRCRMHGGKTPKGALSPHFKTGRWSKYLPTQVRTRYEAGRDDRDLLSLREEILLTDARIAELLSQGDNSQASKKLNKAIDVYAKLQKAMDAQDTDKTFNSLIELGKVLTDAQEATNIWDEVGRQIDRRRNLVDTEQKRLIAMKQFITAEAAYSMVIGMANIVKKYVKDTDTLRNIHDELRGLVNRDTGGRATGEDG